MGGGYKPKDLPDTEERKRKGKDILVEEMQTKKRVSEDGTVEFVKILKRSDYLVVEQLKKLPVWISILSLLLSSEAHRDAF